MDNADILKNQFNAIALKLVSCREYNKKEDAFVKDELLFLEKSFYHLLDYHASRIVGYNGYLDLKGSYDDMRQLAQDMGFTKDWQEPYLGRHPISDDDEEIVANTPESTEWQKETTPQAGSFYQDKEGNIYCTGASIQTICEETLSGEFFAATRRKLAEGYLRVFEECQDHSAKLKAGELKLLR